MIIDPYPMAAVLPPPPTSHLHPVGLLGVPMDDDDPLIPDLDDNWANEITTKLAPFANRTAPASPYNSPVDAKPKRRRSPTKTKHKSSSSHTKVDPLAKEREQERAERHKRREMRRLAVYEDIERDLEEEVAKQVELQRKLDRQRKALKAAQSEIAQLRGSRQKAVDLQKPPYTNAQVEKIKVELEQYGKKVDRTTQEMSKAQILLAEIHEKREKAEQEAADLREEERQLLEELLLQDAHTEGVRQGQFYGVREGWDQGKVEGYVSGLKEGRHIERDRIKAKAKELKDQFPDAPINEDVADSLRSSFFEGIPPELDRFKAPIARPPPQVQRPIYTSSRSRDRTRSRQRPARTPRQRQQILPDEQQTSSPEDVDSDLPQQVYALHHQQQQQQQPQRESHRPVMQMPQPYVQPPPTAPKPPKPSMRKPIPPPAPVFRDQPLKEYFSQPPHDPIPLYDPPVTKPKAIGRTSTLRKLWNRGGRSPMEEDGSSTPPPDAAPFAPSLPVPVVATPLLRTPMSAMPQLAQTPKFRKRDVMTESEKIAEDIKKQDKHANRKGIMGGLMRAISTSRVPNQDQGRRPPVTHRQHTSMSNLELPPARARSSLSNYGPPQPQPYPQQGGIMLVERGRQPSRPQSMIQPPASPRGSMRPPGSPARSVRSMASRRSAALPDNFIPVVGENGRVFLPAPNAVGGSAMDIAVSYSRDGSPASSAGSRNPSPNASAKDRMMQGVKKAGNAISNAAHLGRTSRTPSPAKSQRSGRVREAMQVLGNLGRDRSRSPSPKRSLRSVRSGSIMVIPQTEDGLLKPEPIKYVTTDEDTDGRSMEASGSQRRVPPASRPPVTPHTVFQGMQENPYLPANRQSMGGTRRSSFSEYGAPRVASYPSVAGLSAIVENSPLSRSLSQRTNAPPLHAGAIMTPQIVQRVSPGPSPRRAPIRLDTPPLGVADAGVGGFNPSIAPPQPQQSVAQAQALEGGYGPQMTHIKGGYGIALPGMASAPPVPHTPRNIHHQHSGSMENGSHATNESRELIDDLRGGPQTPLAPPKPMVPWQTGAKRPAKLTVPAPLAQSPTPTIGSRGGFAGVGAVGRRGSGTPWGAGSSAEDVRGWSGHRRGGSEVASPMVLSPRGSIALGGHRRVASEMPRGALTPVGPPPAIAPKPIPPAERLSMLRASNNPYPDGAMQNSGSWSKEKDNLPPYAAGNKIRSTLEEELDLSGRRKEKGTGLNVDEGLTKTIGGMMGKAISRVVRTKKKTK